MEKVQCGHARCQVKLDEAYALADKDETPPDLSMVCWAEDLTDEEKSYGKSLEEMLE